MADFKTHMSVASAASGLIALGFLQAGTASAENVLLYFAMGTLGGILPDVDLDHSIPTKFLFGCLAIILSFLVMFSQVHRYSIVESVVLWLLVFITIRHPAYYLFARLTVHRGIFHSIPAGIFFWLATTAVSHGVFHFSDLTAWVTGFFVFLGYLIHLILDECYSVDLANMEVKKSFGSALKIGSLQNVKATLSIYVLALAMFYIAPSPGTFFNTVLRVDFYRNIQQKLLPEGKWFQNLWSHSPPTRRSSADPAYERIEHV